MSCSNALVIGANGGIGQELVKQLQQSGQFTTVYAVSRSLPLQPIEGVEYHRLEPISEAPISEYCRSLAQTEIQFSLIISCTGVLHGQAGKGVELSPEKRLGEVTADKLTAYFSCNTIIPSLWLKHVEPLLRGHVPAKLVFLTGRIGSIEDNKLGGWYGYRASKAALNMLLKCAQVEFQRRAKNVSIVSYHPGTVDTALSKPFQANVRKNKLFSSEFSVSQLLKHLPAMQAGINPHFIDWQGRNIPW